MNRNLIVAIAGVLVVIVAVLALNLASAGTGNVPAADASGGMMSMSGANAAGPGGQGAISATDGETRTFSLGYDGNQYAPAVIRIRQGTKVRIVGDAGTLTGCMKTVNIDGYGIKKPISAGDNVIEFTATTPGTFAIHCNMGMGNGKLIVEDSSGSVPVSAQAPTKASGGMKMGGCGCM